MKYRLTRCRQRPVSRNDALGHERFADSATASPRGRAAGCWRCRRTTARRSTLADELTTPTTRPAHYGCDARASRPGQREGSRRAANGKQRLRLAALLSNDPSARASTTATKWGWTGAGRPGQNRRRNRGPITRQPLTMTARLLHSLAPAACIARAADRRRPRMLLAEDGNGVLAYGRKGTGNTRRPVVLTQRHRASGLDSRRRLSTTRHPARGRVRAVTGGPCRAGSAPSPSGTRQRGPRERPIDLTPARPAIRHLSTSEPTAELSRSGLPSPGARATTCTAAESAVVLREAKTTPR